MRYYNKLEITQVLKNSRAILAIYKGATLVWQSIRSCFGNGSWVEDRPWSDEEGWKD